MQRQKDCNCLVALAIVALVATVRTPASSRAGIVAGLLIDANSDVSQNAISRTLAKTNVGHERVVQVGGSILGKTILLVGQVLLLVGVVRVLLLDLVVEGLVEVQLAEVVGAAAGVRVVGQQGVALGGQDVDVVGAAAVVAREDGVELDDALGVGLGYAAQEGGVEAGLAGALGDARVDSGGVGLPVGMR